MWLPSIMGNDLWMRVVRGQLLAQLEDGQGHRNDEREEGQLKSVPSFDSQYTKRQWNQRHGLQQYEDENRHKNLLDFRLLPCYM